MGIKEQKKVRIHKQLEEIINNLDRQAKVGDKIHEVELSLFRTLLLLGKSLLLYYIITLVTLILTRADQTNSGEN